jgi:site-specific recombinase XerD
MSEADAAAELAPHAAAAVGDLAELEGRAGDLARASRAASTWRAYDSDLRHFRAWCSERGLNAVPATPATVAGYLADLETTHRPATIRRRLASISVAHQAAGLESPTADAGVRAVAAGIRRRHGTAPRKVQAIRTQLIARMVPPRESERLADIRDRALILLGFAAALRRSELVALDIENITEDDYGLRLHLRRSKTDQEGANRIVGVPYGSYPDTCPVRAWRAWREALGEWEAFFDVEQHEFDFRRSPAEAGPAFRAVGRYGIGVLPRRLSDRAVAVIIKRRALAAGLDPALFSGHSLRAGFATEAYAQGVPELAIMRHGRWRSAATMRGYVEEGSFWNDNAAAKLGL